MDPILAELNKKAATQFSKQDLGRNLQISNADSSRFSNLMAEKNSQHLQELIEKSFDLNQSQVPQSAKAEDIHLSVDGNGEVKSIDDKAIDSNQNTLYELFGQVNGDFNRLNSMVDLVSSGTKLSQRDLIGLQVFSARAIFSIETFTRVAEQASKTVNTLYNMQV